MTTSKTSSNRTYSRFLTGKGVIFLPTVMVGFIMCIPATAQLDELIRMGAGQIAQSRVNQKAKAAMLADAKQAATQEIARTQRLLDQANGNGNQFRLVSSERSLTLALAGKNTQDILQKTNVLMDLNRDLELYIQKLSDGRRIANQELARTQALLSQAQGYEKQSEVAAAQRSVEVALAQDNPEGLRTMLQPLVAGNRDLEQYVQDKRAAADKRQQEESQLRAFTAAKERGGNAIRSATAEMEKAAKWLRESAAVATTMQQMRQAIMDLSPMLQNNDLSTEPQMVAVTGRLLAREAHLRTLTEIFERTK